MKFATTLSKCMFAGLMLFMFLCLPASALARSTPVKVKNFPDVQTVEDANHPSKQRYHWDDTNFSQIESGRNTSLSIGVSTDVVPEGKVLIVTHISYNGSSTGFQAAPLMSLDIIDVSTGYNNWVVTHYLTPQRYQAAHGRLRYVGSQAMSLVVHAGEKIQISMSALVDEDTSFSGAVSGYLVDAP